MGGMLALLGIVLSIVLYRERNVLGAQEGERLQTQAHVVDENLIRQLEGANSALAGVRDELEHARCTRRRDAAAMGISARRRMRCPGLWQRWTTHRNLSGIEMPSLKLADPS